MTKEEEIQQIEYYTKWLKENGLNPKLWDLIDSMAASLKEHKVSSLLEETQKDSPQVGQVQST